ncbi:hel308 [Symbiodinium microadriaticum]|nr:hel308 [Symbiodinium microadriaticum]
MKYVSIDIETLGLDPEWCDVIEFGAVIDDLASPIETLPRFHCYITRPGNKYRGEPYAMAMHSKILYRIANREHGFTYTPHDLLDEVFASWLTQHEMLIEGDPVRKSITIAGKNFATFDLNFLKKLGFGKLSHYKHRIIDPGSMFLKINDQMVPGLKDCMTRANVEGEVDHTAVEDAIDVIKCVRYKLWNNNRTDLQEVIESADPEKRPKKFDVFERVNGELTRVATFFSRIQAEEYIASKSEAVEDLIPTKDFPHAHWGFTEFNPVQSRLMETYDGESNIAIAAATSAGKTVCAEMYMSYEVRERGGKALYVGPLKALAKEKEGDWKSSDHHFNDKNISICTGDFRLTKARIKELDRADIIVMTPEMLASRCRNHKSEKSGFLKDIGTVVFDESHLLTVPSRGDHIEVALMKLTEINPDVRIVLLSATMPNVNEICEWVSHITDRDTYYLESEYRPCPLNVWYETYYDGDRQYDDKEAQKVGTAMGIVEYYPDDKFLIFVHTKRTGKLMLEQLKRNKIKAEFHNADLALDKRLKVEKSFKEDKDFRVIVATSTLAWGLNLPARRVIIVGVHRGLAEVENYDIWQMIGRSGRVGLDPRGDAYVLVPESTKKETIARIKKKRKIESTLLEYLGTAEQPHYKTLAFHIVAEIHQGNVKTKEGFHQWYRYSLAHHQDLNFGDAEIDRTIDLLQKNRVIYVDKDTGEYKTSPIGIVASIFYYSPFDVADLRKNFKWVFETHRDKDDFAVAMALGSVDTHKFGIVNKQEKAEMDAFRKKVESAFGDTRFTQGAIKAGAAYFNMMRGRKSSALLAFQSMLMSDMDRKFQVIHSIDSMSEKWDQKDWFNTLNMRLKYGVTPDLVELCGIPNVGAARARRLKAQRIKDIDDFLSYSDKDLAGIMKCSEKLATEAKAGARLINIKKMMP